MKTDSDHGTLERVTGYDPDEFNPIHIVTVFFVRFFPPRSFVVTILPRQTAHVRHALHSDFCAVGLHRISYGYTWTASNNKPTYVAVHHL